jgi:hypothetical protein
MTLPHRVHIEAHRRFLLGRRRQCNGYWTALRLGWVSVYLWWRLP